MITPSPQINKTFDAPLAARPIPIRTGSLSPTPSPARSRAAGLRQATSLLGMRGLQGISHLRSLTMPQKSGSFGGRRGGSVSSSGASTSSGGAASRKGTRERPLVIGSPFFDAEEARDTVMTGLPPRFCALPIDGPPMSLPALGPRASAIRIPFLNTDHFHELHAQATSIPENTEPAQTEVAHHRRSTSGVRSGKTGSTSSAGTNGARYSTDKRVGGIEMWDVALGVDHGVDHDVDQDALRDALEDHPSPLSSNPTSEHDGSEPSTPWPAGSPTSEFGTAEEINPYWRETSTPSPKRRSRSLHPARASIHMVCESPSALSSPEAASVQAEDPCDGDIGLPHLHREIANLRAGNTALMTLKTVHEDTIALLRENVRSHDNAIAKLAWQVQAKDTEQICIVENFCEEMASRNREIESLREDKSYLMGEIEQLEKKIAKSDNAMDCGVTRARRSRAISFDEDGPAVSADNPGNNDHRQSGTALLARSPSPHQPPHSIEDLLTPTSMRSSLFVPRPSSSVSNRSLYAASQVPGVDGAPSIRGSLRTDRESGQVEQNNVSAEQAAFGIDNQDRHSRNSQFMAAKIVLAAKATLEHNLHTTQEKLAAAEAHGQELQVQLAHQASHFHQLLRPFAGIISTPSALMPIPDLPVLTYRKPSATWIDRVLTTFNYLGLLDFIQRDVPRPETSTWDATEVADWTSRRLRAVVLLKHAVDDDILEDVLHLCERRDTAPSRRDFDMSSPALEDPHQLFTTITCLRRIVSPSPTDLSWLDRIEDPDFDGIEGFTSLMLCIDKRHGVMYGTSADHYDALMPKLQETMSRRFPDLKSSTFAVGSAGLPNKWRQLSVWMAKVGKSRQISEAC